MPDIVLIVLAVIFVLGVAINIHEFGHFIVGKLLGMRVEAYSFFGLGPRVWGFKRGHTDYRIGAIPLGAYVKFYGDEATSSLEGGSSDGESVPDSELFELRPRWQKFLVMLGGPFMNIVLALAIPMGLGLMYGVPSPTSTEIGFVRTDGAADRAGIEVGDNIIAFDGIKNPTWMRIQEDTFLLPEKKTPITIERGGKAIELSIVPTKVVRDGNELGALDMYSKDEVATVVLNGIAEGKPAARAGLKEGDEVLSINGALIPRQAEMLNAVLKAKDNPMNIVVNRDGVEKEFVVKAEKIDEKTFRIGVRLTSKSTIRLEPTGVSGALSYAFDANWRIIRLTGKAFGQMFAGDRPVGDGIAGPIGIVDIISKVVLSAGFLGLLNILMVISLNLGVFNLLPIPMLDGGQIAVLGIEAILALFGMKLSIAIKEKIQLIGLGLILLLMVLVVYFDISKLIG